MLRIIAALGVAAALAIALPPAEIAAQDAKSSSASKTVKAGPGQKVCNYKFPSGERRSWVCDKAVPCCAWDEIKYVKCGTTWSGCL